MQTATHFEGLVVRTEPKALDEAKSLFAPYAPPVSGSSLSREVRTG